MISEFTTFVLKVSSLVMRGEIGCSNTCISLQVTACRYGDLVMSHHIFFTLYGVCKIQCELWTDCVCVCVCYCRKHHKGKHSMFRKAYGKDKYHYNMSLQEVVARYTSSHFECFIMENFPENKDILFLSSPMTCIVQVSPIVLKQKT